MKFTTLASGSSGNATWVESEGNAFLIDAGQSAKYLLETIENHHLGSSKLKGIFLTHEHTDHWRGAPGLARKLNIPVFLTEGTWQVLSSKFHSDQKIQIIRQTDFLNFHGFAIRSHPVIHDAAEPVCYSVEKGPLFFAVVTDLGQLDSEVARVVSKARALVFESNYDPQMLQGSKYPESLKRRIAGGQGHLSNREASEFLAKHLNSHCHLVVLAHLSENNNTAEKALEACYRPLKGHRMKGLSISVAPRFEPFGLMDLSSLREQSAGEHSENTRQIS